MSTVMQLGCIAVTSAEDGGAETTQYLILQGPDDGTCGFLKSMRKFVFICNINKKWCRAQQTPPSQPF